MTVEWEINKSLDEVIPDRGVVGEITYSAPHALYIEFDTSYAGSKPPYEPIREWVGREWSNLGPVKDVAKESLGDDYSQEELKKVVTFVIIESMDTQEGIHFGKRAIEHGKEKADMVANVHKGRENPYELMAENLVEIMFEHSQGTIENEAKSSGELKDSGDWEVYEAQE
mgnify:CR=1 FL=1